MAINRSKIAMNKSKNNSAKSLPYWQLNKMKMIHTERWSEIWQAVETRNQKNFYVAKPHK